MEANSEGRVSGKIAGHECLGAERVDAMAKVKLCAGKAS